MICRLKKTIKNWSSSNKAFWIIFNFAGIFVNSSFYQFALAGNKNIEIRCVFFFFWVTFRN